MTASHTGFTTRLGAGLKHGYTSINDYLAALRQALAGLSLDLGANAVSDVEKRYAEAAAAGRTEQDIVQSLPDPRQIAARLKAAASSAAFVQNKTPTNLWRLFMSFIGLVIFNLFMVVPAIVFSAFLVAFYAVSFAFFIGGIAMTSTGISGVNEIIFDGSDTQVITAGGTAPTRVDLTADTLRIEPAANHRTDDGRIHISADLDTYSRGEQTAAGLGMVAGGIALLLLCLLVTKYTLIGIKRYAVMNYRMLRGA